MSFLSARARARLQEAVRRSGNCCARFQQCQFMKVQGLAGGLTGIAPIGKYIPGVPETEADAPPSEMPRDFRVVNEEEEEDEEKELMTRPVL